VTSRKRRREGRKKAPRTKPRRPTKRPRKKVAKAATASRAVARWNPEADDVQRSVVQLVLTLVELVRKLMERQAIRRMEQRTLTSAETEAVGAALREIERTIRDIGVMFDITPEDLNLDLGAIKLL
jgi:hypothetical protein